MSFFFLKETNFVGMTRFELATPRPPDVYATGLRHIPNLALHRKQNLHNAFVAAANVNGFYKNQLSCSKFSFP
jgi:hypothetical protein